MQRIIYSIPLCWGIVISFKIALRARLKSFFCIGFSIVLALIPFLTDLKGFAQFFIWTAGNIFFCLGIFVIVFRERLQLKEIWKVTNINDWIFGNIPKEQFRTEHLFSNKERCLFIGASLLLMFYAVLDSCFVSENRFGDILLFLVCLGGIIYTLLPRRQR